jgi:tetratricopeptide (TPR) repeat protein
MAKRIFPSTFWQPAARLLSTALVLSSLWAGAAFAKDPFREANPRAIDDKTEDAFREFFEKGNYKMAEAHLSQSESTEPLAQAMRASIIYANWQSEREDKQKKAALLEQFRTAGIQTRATAEQLVSKDPLRGNLYIAVGHFLEGSYVFVKEGTVKGASKSLGSLQEAFKYLDNAAKIDPNDPELNLIKGYMDLFIGLTLPITSPTKAMERLEQFGRPTYLVQRGLALGYRDLNQQDKALTAIDRALKLTPDNPELDYLKAQILYRRGDYKNSIAHYEKALSKQDRLPGARIREITWELNRAKTKLAGA